MLNHQSALVPIEAWGYSSTELKDHGYSIDIGLFAESLIYYPTVLLNVQNQPQFASFLEWFRIPGKLKLLQSLLKDGHLKIYDYGFSSPAVKLPEGYALINVQDEIQAKPNTFEDRFLNHDLVKPLIPDGSEGKNLKRAFLDNVYEVKADEFGEGINGATEDIQDPRRLQVILDAYLAEIYKIKNLGHPPKLNVSVQDLGGGRKQINWSVDLQKLRELSGPNINFHQGQPLTAAAMAHRFIWSATTMKCDLFLGSPMSVLVGDKLYDASRLIQRPSEIIRSLQLEMQYPSIRTLVNQATLGIEDVLEIRESAGKFREWLATEGERDRNAIIAYHNELSTKKGLVRYGNSILSLFGVLGGAAVGEFVKLQFGFQGSGPQITGAIIGQATSSFVSTIARNIAKDWKPIVFGNWLEKRIAFLENEWEKPIE